jgi:hypothetical protein
VPYALSNLQQFRTFATDKWHPLVQTLASMTASGYSRRSAACPVRRLIKNAIVPHGAATLRQRYLPPWGWANQNSDLRLGCDATDDDEVTNPKIEIERREFMR